MFLMFSLEESENILYFSFRTENECSSLGEKQGYTSQCYQITKRLLVATRTEFRISIDNKMAQTDNTMKNKLILREKNEGFCKKLSCKFMTINSFLKLEVNNSIRIIKTKHKFICFTAFYFHKILFLFTVQVCLFKIFLYNHS